MGEGGNGDVFVPSSRASNTSPPLAGGRRSGKGAAVGDAGGGLEMAPVREGAYGSGVSAGGGRGNGGDYKRRPMSGGGKALGPQKLRSYSSHEFDVEDANQKIVAPKVCVRVYCVFF